MGNRNYCAVHMLRSPRLMVKRLSEFGSAPLCNLRPERAFKFNGFVFPLCCRCTGLIAGSCLCLAIKAFGVLISLPITVSAISLFPLALDGLLQYFGILESTNIRRFLTGFLFGFAIAPHGIFIDYSKTFCEIPIVRFV